MSRRSLITKISLLGLNQSSMSRRDLIAKASLLSPFPSLSQSLKSILVVNNREQFIYGPLEGRTVLLRPIGRPYGLSTAHRKAVRFILRTVSRTYDQLRTPFRRQGISYIFLYFIVLFLRISFIFYGFIFIYFIFYSFTKANYGGYTQAVLFFSTASI